MTERHSENKQEVSDFDLFDLSDRWFLSSALETVSGVFLWFHHDETGRFHHPVEPPCQWTHYDQAHFALLVGPVGSQDGDHHGNSAHNVEDDEAGGPTLHLEAEQVIDRLKWCFVFSVCKCLNSVCSYVSSINASEDLREQSEPKDDSAQNLKQKKQTFIRSNNRKCRLTSPR